VTVADPIARMVADELGWSDPARLDEPIRAARDAWPDVVVEPAAFARMLADRLRVVDLAELPIADLYIACACAAGDDVAIARFEARYFAGIAPALARMQLDGDTIAEVKQHVRERLFVGAPPRIAQITGHGDLGALIRIMAVRTALNLRRRDHRLDRDDDLVLAAISSDADPELAVAGAERRAVFRRALEDAILALTPRDRGILRLHLIQRLSIDDIGRVYRVHRATAARWLEQVRDRLRVDTRKLLSERLDLADTELESFVRVVESRIEISFARLLATE
jgi:RNA polymerase sigma-70 factor (ECF subfamily)